MPPARTTASPAAASHAASSEASRTDRGVTGAPTVARRGIWDQTHPYVRLVGVAEQSRFIALSDLAEILSISASQAYALVRRGDLRAIKVGGRGQWRVERSELEAYIARLYEESARYVAEHPFVEAAEY